ncbi:selenocysteine lyase-like isoform X2 [Bacillus rossius redtenbacheri]|uniref:selenocysteine lyase-like isoform X2 n=1 Tax=Bacillus rossius redtenbacheri TaxID=93214 RepID=UPI002FDCD804
MGVYLDVNATTPCEKSVIDAITITAAENWANPSSSNAFGKLAQDVINNSRNYIAEMIHGNPEDIIFTSGGTEANNTVVKGVVEYHRDWRARSGTSSGRPHVITTNVEHDSVALPIRNLEKNELIDATFVPVGRDGCLKVEDLVEQIRPTTCLVSVMMANNETGVIMPVETIGRRIFEVNNERKSKDLIPILFHSDAAQAVGKIPVDVQVLNVDYLTIVGHKFYGPRIGCLYARGLGARTPVYPLMHGGGQEGGYRPGTENTPMVAGLGEAARLVRLRLGDHSRAMASARDYLEGRLTEVFGAGQVRFNCSSAGRLPNTCSVSFVSSALPGHQILAGCPEVTASVGAACHTQDKPSEMLFLNLSRLSKFELV